MEFCSELFLPLCEGEGGKARVEYRAVVLSLVQRGHPVDLVLRELFVLSLSHGLRPFPSSPADIEGDATMAP